TGLGVFTDSGQRLGDTNTIANVVLLGDLDNDGDLDAFVLSAATFGGAHIWLNNGSGQFTDSGQVVPTGGSLSAALGDVNGDGKLDAIVLSNGTATTFLNSGSASFAAMSQSLTDTNAQRVVVGDLDGDGDLDLVLMGSNSLSVWFNDGSGHFTPNPASV